MALVINRKARHEYDIEASYTAGIVLSGQEVKSLRQKHASLAGSYVQIVNGEAVLLNAQINPYFYADTEDYDPNRTRKLLLKKKELLEMQDWTKSKKRALIPLEFFVQGKFIKLKIGVGRPLKKYDKRQKLKEKDQRRQIAREMKRR